MEDKGKTANKGNFK